MPAVRSPSLRSVTLSLNEPQAQTQSAERMLSPCEVLDPTTHGTAACNLHTQSCRGAMMAWQDMDDTKDMKNQRTFLEKG